MKKSTKGAIAAAGAAALLLGGGGTLAYWTADGTVDGGQIQSGSLTLTMDDCSATDWTFSDADTGTPTGPATLLVPGDTVEKTCTGTIDGTGDHLRATVAIDPESLDTTIGTASPPATAPDNLTITAALTAPADAGDGIAISGPTDVSVTITVAWPYGTENNGSQLSTATLNQIAVQAVQVHD